MNRIEEAIERFKLLAEYRTSLKEAYGDVDTNGWICVGEVNYNPWGAGDNTLYIMVDPELSMYGGKMIHKIAYTTNADGTGKQVHSIPTRIEREAIIYPEHQDDEYGELFLGKKKDPETIKQMHQEFLSKLFRKGNYVIIHHNSSYKITDGVVKKGKPNGWSLNSDIGIYFWGSRNSGKDPSNSCQYIYYCLIPLQDLYDFETNEERIMSLDKALQKYDYAGQNWKKSDAIVVSTLKPTEIWCILDTSNGKWYDKDWNEIEKPF